MLELDFSENTAPLYEGFVEGLSEKEYRDYDAISQSDIKTLITEPFRYFNQIELKQTESMIEGTLMHLLFSAPHLVSEQFFITNEKKSERVKEEANGRHIIKEDKYQNLVACVDYTKEFMLKYHQIDLDAMDSEVSFFGKYNGFNAKGRADKITDNRRAVFDFKKCASAKHRDFIKTVCDLHYGIQEVFYRELMGLEKFEWIAIETTPLVNKMGKHFYMIDRFETTPDLVDVSKRLIDLAFEILESPELCQKYSAPIYPSEFIVNDVKNGIEMIKKIEPPMWYRFHSGI